MNKHISYAFFGTPEFASIILEKLIGAGMPPVALICNPDRPVGRKKIVTPPPAKASILSQDESIRETITILQPEKVKEIEAQLRELQCDIFIVAAYGNIIPQSILSIPRLGTIGVHPSLLPRLRGATPIQSAILTGEQTTGVSLFVVDAKVDHGPVIAQEELGDIDMHSVTYPELHHALAELGATMLIQTLPVITKAIAEAPLQDESKVTMTTKFTSQDGEINASDLQKAMSGEAPELAITIDRKIRAFNPEPSVFTIRDGVRTKLLQSAIRDGALVLKQIQIAGKLPQSL